MTALKGSDVSVSRSWASRRARGRFRASPSRRARAHTRARRRTRTPRSPEERVERARERRSRPSRGLASPADARARGNRVRRPVTRDGERDDDRRGIARQRVVDDETRA